MFRISEEVPLGHTLGLLLDVLKQAVTPCAPGVSWPRVPAPAQDNVHVSSVAKCEV